MPELASRQHVRDICGVVEAALGTADASMEDLGAVAVTQGPGLVGSLLVGVAFAKAFAWARGIPVVPVHHLAGHIESLVLAHGELPLPAAVLVVSGGHTSLYLITEPGAYRLIGRTRDDAAGEAYDKVAKLLGLGYPGGPVIDRLAREGNDRAFDFPTARLTHADRNAPRATSDGLLPPDVARRVDFSFSGLKTAVLRLVRERTGIDQRGRAANADGAGAGCRRPRSPTSAPASSASSSTCCSIGRSKPRAGSAPAASASPAASRPTAACAPKPKSRGRPRRHSRSSCRRWRSRPTTPR